MLPVFVCLFLFSGLVKGTPLAKECSDTIDETCIEIGATLDVPVPDEWTCRVKRKLKARNMNNVDNCRSCVGSTEELGTTVSIGSRSPTFVIAVMIE